MKILLVSYYFPPVNVIGAVRVGKFAKYLIENGHEVRVLAARDSIYPAGLPVEIPESCIVYTDPVQINLLPYLLIGGGRQAHTAADRELGWFVSFLGRVYRLLFNFPDGQVGWLPSAVREGRRLIEEWKPDLIYGSAMPFTSLLIARRLSMVSGVPYVAELRDLWMDSHYYDHPWPRRVIEERLERRTLSRAIGLVTVSEPLADILRLKYGIRTTVALNGFDPADFELANEHDGGGPEDVLRIVYTGTIYPSRRDPTPLFKALAAMGEERFRYRVDFYGRRLATARQLAEAHGVADVVGFNDPIPYREALRLQASADVLLLLLWDVPEERGVYTGKLFEYLGARRPILSLGAEQGVAAELIINRSAGLVSNDPTKIGDQLDIWRRDKLAGKLQPLADTDFSDLTRAEQFRSLTAFLSNLIPPADTRPVDVQVVVNQLDVGGTERHICQVLPRLDPKRFRVAVQVLRGGGNLEPVLRRSGVPVASPSPRLPRWGQRLTAATSLLRRLTFRRPRVVHLFLPEAYLVGGVIGLLTRQPRIVMSRRSLNNYQVRYPFLAGMEKWLHRRMTALIGNSRAVRRQLEEETDGAFDVRLIYNGIDVGEEPDAATRARARRELAIPDDTVVFVIVANLIPYKGHEDLLRAFAAVRQRLTRPWRLYCVGRGGGGDTLAALGADLGLADNLHWVGERFPATPYLHAADVGVLASHEEGFSNSILEGMAAALPMIVTDVGGNPEAVVDDETGLVVPARDPETMGAAIVRLAEDPELRARLGRAGRRRVETEFSLQRCAAEYEKLYTDVAAARGAR